MSDPKITIGISSCLLGQQVRYDNSHKHNRYITETLGDYFDFRPFCPEVAIGLGVPRPPIRLVSSNHEIRAIGVKDSSLDVTDKLTDYAEETAAQCHDLSGYIFKSRSPSCGMERVKVYSDTGHPIDSASGLYAAGIMHGQPSLPVEEEGRLMDPRLRENFVERVFIYNRWQEYLFEGLTAGRLVEFHSRHKFTVLAHDEPIYRELGRIVADAGKGDLQKTADIYISLLMQALKKLATNKTHTNVLQHIMGFFKENMSSEDKRELLDAIDDFRLGHIPLLVPITLINHYLRLHPDDYIASQYYLNPHPKELKLRNSL